MEDVSPYGIRALFIQRLSKEPGDTKRLCPLIDFTSLFFIENYRGRSRVISVLVIVKMKSVPYIC